MKWLSLLLIDIIFVLQLILFLQWYYPKIITVTGCTTSFAIFENLLAISEISICYILTIYNIKKGLKEY